MVSGGANRNRKTEETSTNRGITGGSSRQGWYPALFAMALSSQLAAMDKQKLGVQW